MHSMHDPELHTPILRHFSISRDQQAVAQLQLVSKELNAAVSQLLAGQVPVALAVHEKSLRRADEQIQRVHMLVHWLSKHAGLLQTFDLQLQCRIDAEAAAAAGYWRVGPALQQAACIRPLQLQSFCLQGILVNAGILEQLPVPHLTRLCADVDVSRYASMQAIAALSGLRCLQLCSSDTAASTDNVLAPLARLPQLTELHVGTVRPAQLQWVPATVQQLHLAVGRLSARQLEQLATWLAERASIVRALQLLLDPSTHSPAWRSALDALVAAFQTAVAAATAAPTGAAAVSAAPAAAAAPASATCSSWQLQQLTINSLSELASAWLQVTTAGRIMQHLPAGTLRRLDCKVTWSDAAQINTVCTHTGLRSLSLGGNADMRAHADDVLQPISALQQLTALTLAGCFRREQLQHLQLPQLQHLAFRLSGSYSTTEELAPLRLEQLTALQVLQVDAAANGLLQRDCLPPNLCQLRWSGWVTGDTAGVQPLLALSRLQQLTIRCDDVMAAQTEEARLAVQDLLQLSTIGSLQELKLVVYKEASLTVDDAAAAVWHALPLKELDLGSSGLVHSDVLQQLSRVKGLTRLSLCSDLLPAGRQAATHQQLGLLLQQLTALQDLSILNSNKDPEADEASSDDLFGGMQHNAAGIATLLQAICDLSVLERVQVDLPVRLEYGAVQQLSSMFAALLPAGVWFQLTEDVLDMRSDRL